MTTNISNNFSFTRLLMVMKRDFTENWKSNLQIALSIYGAFLLSALMSYTAVKDMIDSSIYFSYRLGFVIATALITYFVLHISAGHIMDVLNSKEKRISYLMLPATQAEKFVSRALQAVIGTSVLILVTLLLSELTRLVLFPLFGAPEVLQKFCLFDFKDIIFRGAYWTRVDELQIEGIKSLTITNSICWLLASHSLFILGGVYFYKKPVIKTFSLIILGTIVLGIFGSYWEDIIDLQSINATTSLWISNIIALIITIICWRTSYFLFTRSQVTERINFKFLKRG